MTDQADYSRLHAENKKLAEERDEARKDAASVRFILAVRPPPKKRPCAIARCRGSAIYSSTHCFDHTSAGEQRFAAESAESDALAASRTEAAALREALKKMPHEPTCLSRVGRCVGAACNCARSIVAEPMPTIEELTAALASPAPASAVKPLNLTITPDVCIGSGWPAIVQPFATVASTLHECGICHQVVECDAEGRTFTHPSAEEKET